jgi:hypothetical protein
MCGPADDGKRRPEQEKALEDFSSACFETLRESSVFSASAPMRILDGEEQTIAVSASRRIGSKKNRRAVPWIQ